MTRVKLNLKGFRELRTAPKVQEFVRDIAEDVAVESGTEAFQDVPRNRARSAVVGSTKDAEKMMRALGSQIGRH